MNNLKLYTLRIVGLLFISAVLIYSGLVITLRYVNSNIQAGRSESIQFMATEIHDQIIELNLMSNLIKLQEFLQNYCESNEVSIYKVHVLNKNYEVVASSDINFVMKKFFDESYRQVKERTRLYITNKKYENESIIECACPIRPSIFNQAVEKSQQPNSTPPVLGILLVWKRTSPVGDLLHSDYHNWAITFVLLTVLAVVVFIGIYTNKFFSRLGTISGAAQKIALGDYQQRIDHAENTEFGLLAESFNQIADNLEGRIRETNFINKKLEESNVEKEKQVWILSQMAGGVAHEVRNPLGGIRGFAELLLNEIPAGDEKKKKYVRYILDEVKTLESLVQNVLDFARPKPPRIGDVDFEMIMDSVSNIIQSRIDAAEKSGAKIEYEYKIAADAQEARADFQQIRQVVLNLTLNACDAMADAGGRLAVNIERCDPALLKENGAAPDKKYSGCIKITISDTGCGMKKEIMDNLFTPFYTTKASGTGLGLSICQKIVERHCGVIKIKSEVGKGTSFFVILPLFDEAEGVA